MAIFNELDKRLVQVGKSVAQRTNDMAEAMKTNSELEKEEEKLEENYAILGQIYVQKNSENLGMEYQKLYDQILVSEEKITRLQEQQSLHNGHSNEIRCPNCYAVLPENSIFCASCGTKLDQTGKEENPSGQSQQQTADPVQDYQQQQGFQGGFYPNLTEEQLPAKFKPITAWGYFGWSFIFTIPLIGILIALIKAFGNTENINLRNFARSMFCYFIIAGILCLLIFGTAGCFVGMM